MNSLLLKIKTTATKEIKEIRDTKEELANALRIAIGYDRGVIQFARACRMTETEMLVKLLDKNICELPDRKILRKIASASEGRITHTYLYDICGYSESDLEEDKSWANWKPMRGEIYYADLGVNQDREQNGVRPVLVISNDVGNMNGDIVVVLPITSKRKFSPKIHVFIGQEYGLDKDSYALSEQIRCISKRRFFYNSDPWKLSKLSNRKMQEVQNALEIELGFDSVSFDENKAFKMIEHIEILKNINNKTDNLIDMISNKMDEFINYCSKYYRNYKVVMDEYQRLNKYICA